MGLREQFQIFVLAVIGVINFITIFFSVIIDYQSKPRKKSLVVIEISTFMLMLADVMTHLFDGTDTLSGYVVLRLCNFLAFFIIYIELICLNSYVHTYISVRQKIDIWAKKTINVLSFAGIFLLAVSQVTGMYYYFDDNNCYVRGKFFAFSFIMPLVIIVVMFMAAIRHRKEMSLLIYLSVLVFTLLPLTCAIIQAMFYGTSLFDPSIGISAITIYAMSLMDQNDVLRKAVKTEKMTGCPNTYGFLEELEKRIASKKINKFSALYFDIVRLGLINRKYGSQVGDQLIINYTKEVGKFMVDGEVLGRLGGNFYTAIVYKERTEEFLNFLKGVNVPIMVRDNELIVTVAAIAGVYEIPDNDCTANQIMTNVAMAVSLAKNVLKKPYVYLTKELMQEMNEQRHLQEIIPKCMEKGEFIPYFQPKVNLETLKLCGAEALVRWNHEGKLISPGKFIPLLEQNESICEMDFYMLDMVCRNIKDWIEEGLNPPVVSVNFSRKNLGDASLAKNIHNVIKKYDIPTALIQVEFTETIDEYSILTLKSVVEALQKYGITAAIDDFGVGSSSIGILKEVPFDVLKIDKSFIDSISDKDRHILGHIIGMANEMEAKTITEGVETKQQIDVLKKLGCGEIQGYYFDKPLPKEIFEERMRQPQYSI